jgi:hypothetical protein
MRQKWKARVGGWQKLVIQYYKDVRRREITKPGCAKPSRKGEKEGKRRNKERDKLSKAARSRSAQKIDGKDGGWLLLLMEWFDEGGGERECRWETGEGRK